MKVTSDIISYIDNKKKYSEEIIQSYNNRSIKHIPEKLYFDLDITINTYVSKF